MPASSNEPEKYSIDEMMDRLKGLPSPKHLAGELVTREDGTQAIKVRKRKRRTEQPKREAEKRRKRMRVVQVSAALAAVILLALGVAGAFVYTNTSAFRTRISNAVAEALGGKAEFRVFRVTPFSANAEAIDLFWPEGHALRALKLKGITSKISPASLTGNRLEGDELVAREGEVFLDSPQPGDPLPKSDKSLSFKRVSVTKLNAIGGDPAAPSLKLTQSEVSLTRDPERALGSLKFHRGTLTLPDWPALQIDRALIQFDPESIQVASLRFNDSLTPRGSLDLSGPIQPFKPGEKSTLKVKMESFNLADLAGKDLGRLLDARIDTRESTAANILTFSPDSLNDLELVVAFRSTLTSRFAVAGFPFLSSLSRTLGDKWYDQPNLDESVGTFVRKGNTIELKDLYLERKTHMAIRGNLTITDGRNLSGALEIGIPESVVQLSPNPRIETIFSPLQDGFRWVTLTIGGTLSHPSDNFSALYSASVENNESPTGTDATETTPNAPKAEPVTPQDGETDPGKLFDEFTRPPGR